MTAPINQELHMKKFFSPLAVVTALSLAPAVAWADVDDRTGVYGVVGVGKPKVAAHGRNMDANQSKPRVDNAKLGYTLGTGYRLNNYLAVEADFYGQAGNRKNSSTRTGDASNGRNGSVKNRAYTVSGLAIMPLGDHVELFGRAGVGRMNTSFTAATGSNLGKARSSGMATQFGAGANVYVGDNSFLRAEWTTLRGKGKDDVAKALGRDKLRASNVMVSYGHNF
ncbi:outer membrane beta-barrel protein [Stenotrophomonas rhizophila]